MVSFEALSSTLWLGCSVKNEKGCLCVVYGDWGDGVGGRDILPGESSRSEWLLLKSTRSWTVCSPGSLNSARNLLKVKAMS